MRAASQGEFAKEHGILGFLHYFVFPLDLFTTGDEEYAAAREQRVTELTPIMIWLIPLLLLISNITYLNVLGLLALFVVETIILVVLSMIYCMRGSLGFIIETFVNYAISFLIWGFIVFAFMFLFSSCGVIIFVIAVIALISHFSRGRSYDYDDDW